MKKILVSLLVLAMAAPAMAVVTFDTVNNADGTVTITMDTGGDVVRGVALKVTCTNGAMLVDPGVYTANAEFNTFIDYFAVNGTGDVTGETPNQEGHPFALAGTTAGVAAASDTVFVISMGVLDETENQGGYNGAGDLITFETGAGDVCIELDTVRGGVVGDVALTTSIDTIPDCVTVTGDEPFPSCQDYNLTKKKGGLTDNAVNVADITNIINYINANKVSPTVFLVPVTSPNYDADYNFDAASSAINVADITNMINWIDANKVSPTVFVVVCPL